MIDSDAVRARAARHRSLALRVAEAHVAIGDTRLCAFVSGSTVEELVDERSDVDMSVVLAGLPALERLQQACRDAGSAGWEWTAGDAAEGSFVVSFKLDGVEVQIGYSTHDALQEHLDELLVRHNPDTPLHKLAEGILKAEPLIDGTTLERCQQQLQAFPEPLRRAMVEHALKTPLPWRAISQIIHRDTVLWCRDLQVDACYRLLLALCGLNRRYHTRFQVKRVHKLAAGLTMAPPRLADRLDALLQAPPREAFDALHALEGEVLALVAAGLPDIDLALQHQRRALYVPG